MKDQFTGSDLNDEDQVELEALVGECIKRMKLCSPLGYEGPDVDELVDPAPEHDEDLDEYKDFADLTVNNGRKFIESLVNLAQFRKDHSDRQRAVDGVIEFELYEGLFRDVDMHIGPDTAEIGELLRELSRNSGQRNYYDWMIYFGFGDGPSSGSYVCSVLHSDMMDITTLDEGFYEILKQAIDLGLTDCARIRSQITERIEDAEAVDLEDPHDAAVVEDVLSRLDITGDDEPNLKIRR